MTQNSDTVLEDIKKAIKDSLVELDIAFIDDDHYHTLVNACKFQISRMRGKYTQDQLKQIIKYELSLVRAN